MKEMKTLTLPNGVTYEIVDAKAREDIESTMTEVANINKYLDENPPEGTGTGIDGFSPIATVTQTSTGAVVSITDKNGTTTATITNGKDGKDGTDGEDGTGESIPDYVKGEAESVIDRVIAAQGNRTFTIAAITDMHYGNDGYTEGVKHACKALKYIDSRIKLDAVAVLGDYTDGVAASAFAGAASDCKEVNAVLDSLRFAPNFRLAGNHDFYTKHSPIMHRYIQAYSNDMLWGDRLGGYFYRDFDDFKLRVICLNTAEETKDSLSVTAEQYNWFISALDLSDKSDVADWQTLILSHHPLDWFTNDGSTYYFWQILNAYANGTSWSNSGNTISCNFAGKNAATIVCNIHGHTHNLMARKIAAGQPNTTDATVNVMRIATPEACYGRPNSYNEQWDYNPFGEEIDYPKTPGTADETSFVVYCIDLDDKTIKAVCYGAGYDRTVNYITGDVESSDGGGTTPTVINWLPLAKDADLTTIYNGTGYKANTRVNNSDSETSADGYFWLTGYIPVKSGDVVRVKPWNGVSGSEYLTLNLYSDPATRIEKYTQPNMLAFSTFDGDIDRHEPGLLEFTVPTSTAGTVAYMRMLNSTDVDPTTCIITVNQEIP